MGEEMRVRYYTHYDYPMLCEWWDHYKISRLPEDYIPMTGLVVDECCIGFIYKTDSRFVWFEWITADPKKSQEERASALDYLIECAKMVSSLMGAKALFCSTNHKKLIDRLSKNGLEKTDESVTHFVYKRGN